MSKKNIIINFTDQVFNNRNFTLIPEFIKWDYKQHNPNVGQGREGFVAFINEFVKKFPKLKLQIKHIYEEGDFVISHNLAILSPGEVEKIVFDVYRIENGKLSEHWDCIQDLTQHQIGHKENLF